MQPQASSFVDAFFRGLLGELGDRTFFLTVVFVAWCPWRGVRSGDHSFLQQLLVTLGASTALTLQVFLFATQKKPSAWSGLHDWITCTLLCLFVFKAYVDRTRMDGSSLKLTALEAPLVDPHEEGEQWNRDAFFLPSARRRTESALGSPVSENYGSTPVADIGPATAEPVRINKGPGVVLPELVAFLLSLFVIFIAETDDRSQAILQRVQGDFYVLAASTTGLVGAVVLAYLIGFCLERQCADHTVLTVTICTLLIMSLQSCSQGFLHAEWLWPSPSLAHKVMALMTALAQR